MIEPFDITSQSYSRFTFDREGSVLTAYITSDHPVNGVDSQMHAELARVFNDLQRDTHSDLIVLTAKGKAFCAGGDMDWFEEHIAFPETFTSIAWEAKQIVYSILNMEKPIICRLNGAAAGLGATLALLCDIVIADESAVIGDPHIKVGLVAGDGGAVIWPQLVGYAKAKELLMTGDMLTASEAKELGLLNYALPTQELDSKVTEISNKILSNPKWAVRWTKTTVNIPLRALAAQIMEASVGWESASNYLDDRAEAVAAFKHKRAPKYTGN